MPRSDKKIIDLSDLEQIRKLASMGMTITDIADFFGMSRTTFYERIAEMPDIALTIQEGKAHAKMNLLGKSFLKAMGKHPDNPKEGDNDMLKYLLSRIHGLTEKIAIETPEGTRWEDMNLEELKKELEQMRKRNQETVTALILRNKEQ